MKPSPPKSELDRAASGEGSLGNLLSGDKRGKFERIAAGSPSGDPAIADIISGRRSAFEGLVTSPAQRRAIIHGGDTQASPATDRSPNTPLASVAEIGALVKAARLRLKLSQERFADLAGVGRRFVSELEAGKPTIETGLLLRCCLAAGIDIIARPRH